MDHPDSQKLDGKLRIKLSRPIKIMDEEVETLELREPSASDFAAIDDVQGVHSRSIALIARLADAPPSSIGKLHARDYKKVNEALRPFTE